MPQDWNSSLHTKAFWVRYLAVSGIAPFEPPRRWKGDPFRVAFELPGQCELRLSLGEYVPRIVAHWLELLHPARPAPLLLGRLGDPHQMSDAFRWQEFEALGRYLDGRGIACGPPWATRLLLAPYVAFFEGEVDRHVELLRGCLTESELFKPEEVAQIVGEFGPLLEDFRTVDEFRWTFDQSLGWVAEGKRTVPYSMRHRRNEEFDFSALREVFGTLGIDA